MILFQTLLSNCLFLFLAFPVNMSSDRAFLFLPHCVIVKYFLILSKNDLIQAHFFMFFSYGADVFLAYYSKINLFPRII